MTNPATILIVDDDDPVREMLADYLGDIVGYAVRTAAGGEEALAVLANNRFDMVLSDINMPGMRGFELLQVVRERWPETKRMLVTAYNVEDYVELALVHDVGNIFVKTSPFNFDELRTTITSLLSGDIFGMERYFAPNTPRSSFEVAAESDLEQQAQRALDLLPVKARSEPLRLAITEMLTNAVFYGAGDESADNRAHWPSPPVFRQGHSVQVAVMADTRMCGVSIIDSGGRLTKKEILYWLNRQVSRDGRGLPLGAFDNHGRGLFMTRRFIDRLVVNIAPHSRTEVIAMNYLDRTIEGYKPLYINEI
jgi:DNA-binding NarL/FixJ family response regulator